RFDAGHFLSRVGVPDLNPSQVVEGEPGPVRSDSPNPIPIRGTLETTDLFPGRQVPTAEGAIGVTGQQLLAAGQKAGAHGSGEAGDFAHPLPGLYVPDSERIIAERGAPGTVSREGGRERSARPGEAAHHFKLLRLRWPYLRWPCLRRLRHALDLRQHRLAA